MTGKISILIVDDHQIFRDGLKLLLSQFEFVGEITEASNGKEFLEIIDNAQPQIIFIDINMPEMGGIEATQKALLKYPDLKIIVLTTFHDEDYLEQMMMAGVEGYMLKRSTMQEFDTAIHKVYSGGNFFSDEIINTLTLNIHKTRTKAIKQSTAPELTAREKEVLNLICQGLNNEQVSELMHVSPKTIEKHKSNLFLKTNTKNTVNLIIYSFNNGLIKITEE